MPCTTCVAHVKKASPLNDFLKFFFQYSYQLVRFFFLFDQDMPDLAAVVNIQK